MIKVTVLYPNEEGKKFDFAYYTGTHIPMVVDLLTSMGLGKVEIEKGVSAADPSAPAPFVCVGHLHFNTTDEVHEAFKTHGHEIIADIKNYTEIKPTFQISEIVS